MVMRQRWPELVRVYQQDAQAGTQAVNKLANDAAKAAGFPSNMTRLVQEYILGKLADLAARGLERVWLRWHPAYQVNKGGAA